MEMARKKPVIGFAISATNTVSWDFVIVSGNEYRVCGLQQNIAVNWPDRI